MKNEKKKFRLFDAVLMAVVVVLVVESAAPAAAIGTSQFFWWIFLLILFFIPYGLISSELGTAYAGDGGLYDWVKKAYGPRWGGRLAWFYWINYPIWMASLAVLFVQVGETIFKLELGTFANILIQLIFVWLVVFIGNKPVSESKWIMNLAAFAKIFTIVALAVLGIYVATTRGVANDFSFKNLLPQMNVSSLSNLSVIIFNFLGFEVVATMADDMDDPKKQIPKAIIYGGILIAFFYLIAAFGMSAAIPTNKLSASSGLLDSFILLVGHMNWFVIIIGIMFMYILASEMVSWALGVNYVADYAAKDNNLPKIFGKEDKNGMPVGTGLLNGIVATVLVVIAPIIPNQDIFWAFFSLNVVALLISYTMMFPAFWKLRRDDPEHERPFKVPGNGLIINLMTWVPEILLISTIILTIVPMNGSKEEISTKMPILVGTLLTAAIGEVVVRFAERKHQ
ncbi:APC family permease [Pediococcus claussenii]|uniref:Agmatine/putrescine antiporter n=1 Tax=Pediococcus claussenii (strain ATCC BAA-344 / DSM 14800 / JCM 18046 / KCTC 3811 / LMG 21948 / P06) TaxID=701521 RepID=G8PBD5_PEDCP|nr:APC family permease [Pediococcus claussenii]AEV95924.1 agmatine/putrescine antiporter [Pediococcus claussenii ATCC BAA-344]ANZ69414.1 amino acid:proton antiporter [Pediococcus claussenii]ANZ71234.1 amino acid:proton antiporter [Pediococcus claussenii]KRN20529.1 aguD protein [Pediococcus claussenii]